MKGLSVSKPHKVLAVIKVWRVVVVVVVVNN